MRRDRSSDRTPAVKPVRKIELSEKGIKKRVIIAVALLVVGLAFIGYAVLKWLGQEEGWTRIEPTSQSAESVASDMILLYELGVSDMSATAEYKAISALYTELCANAYRLFHADYGFEDVHNPYYINRNIGQEIFVDPVLYNAFEQIERSGSRFLYAAPFYTEYRNMFYGTEDYSVALLDPRRSESVAEYFTELSVYTSSEEHVRLELLGDCKIILHVSDEFLSFAQENAIDTFIDFYWAKNAFIVDYIAEELSKEGYVYGSISAYDGFMRTMDPRDTSYFYGLSARSDGAVYAACTLEYTGQNSMVFLRSYSTNDRDMIYYQYEDGEERHAYVDVTDGLCKNSLDSLVSYSKERGCGEILLSVMPVYIEDEFDVERLISLETSGVHSVYNEGMVLCYTEEVAVLKDLFDDGKTKFSVTLIK